MGYNVAPIVATGDLWTAAQNNVYLRANLAAMVPGVFTAKGDLFAGTGANAGAGVGAGADGAYLRADSAQTSGVGYLGHIGAGASDVTHQEPTLIANSWHYKRYDTENWDTENANTVGPSGELSYYTAPRAGYWLVVATVKLENQSTTWAAGDAFYLAIRINDVVVSGGALYVQTTGTDVHYMAICDVLELAVGDVVDVAFLWTGNTGSRAILSAYGIFQVAWMGG